MANATIQVRMDSELKAKTESVLQSMGLTMSTAIHLFCHQVIKQRRIPFDIVADGNSSRLDELPKSVNADKMTAEELRQHLLIGYQEALADKARPAAEVFAEIKEKYNI